MPHLPTLPIRIAPPHLTVAAFALAALVLACDPVLWLVNTWRDPSYDSNGAFVAALAAALAGRCLASPVAKHVAPPRGMAIGLLLASALVRLAGQILAINVLGALTLVIDVYALGLLLGLDRRAFSISPSWLAVAFAFSLPLERIVQRCIGYVLQQVSADGACGLLQFWFGSVTCAGIRIVLDGRDVLVDLPCSGARTVLLSLLAFALAACLVQPKTKQIAAGLAMVLTASYIANVLRIAVLAIGIARPAYVGGIDVMAAPWHDTIGLIALMLVLAALLVWTRWVQSDNDGTVGTDRPFVSVTMDEGHTTPGSHRRRWGVLDRFAQPAPLPIRQLALAILALVCALLIVSQPRRPLDVAERNIALDAPAWISGQPAETIALDHREAAYFTQHGGAAVKARYGVHSLLLVRTSSPLRHLHAPEECLRGLGFTVRYAGMMFEPLPTAVYEAVSPEGERFRIDVTFVSNRGHITTNVAAAVWHWLRGEAAVWTAIQRISPAGVPMPRHDQWSTAALVALGVTTGHPRMTAAARGEQP